MILINKKTLFTILMILIVLETICFIAIKYINNDLKNTNNFLKSKTKHLNSKKFFFNPYVEHEKYLSDLDKKPDIYLEFAHAINNGKPYTDFNSNLFKNEILFQGDSWNEVVTYSGSGNDKRLYNLFKNFSDQNDVRIINGGTTSFSPSLYIAQLKILKTYYNINPNKIVLILDQTDLGDEFYARSYYPHLVMEVFLNKIKKNNLIINQLNLNTIKMTKLFINELEYQKNNYDLTNYFSSLKMLLRRIYSKIYKPIQLHPLLYGITLKQEILFLKRLNIYFELANSDNLENLIIVTHPHKDHLNKKYKLNISELVDKFIKNQETDKILHLNFNDIIKKNEVDTNNIFLKDDIFSHLNDESYLKYFYPNIFNRIMSLNNL